LSIGYIFVLIMYETQCLLIGQRKRNGNDIPTADVDIHSLLAYHDKFIYPTDYQLLRVINLSMILSGTLFEMLKIYSPEQAMSMQAEFSNVDEEKIFEQARTVKQKKNIVGNKKANKGKKNKKKRDNKKTK